MGVVYANSIGPDGVRRGVVGGGNRKGLQLVMMRGCGVGGGALPLEKAIEGREAGVVLGVGRGEGELVGGVAEGVAGRNWVRRHVWWWPRWAKRTSLLVGGDLLAARPTGGFSPGLHGHGKVAVSRVVLRVA